MLKKLLILLFSLLVFSFAEEKKSIYINEGITENQIANIKLFSSKSLNMLLTAYSALNKRKIYSREIKSYLEGALFFSNEASQYVPSYLIRKKIEILIRRMNFYPEEDYSTEISSLIIDIDEIAGSLSNYEILKDKLVNLLEKAKFRDNIHIKDELESIIEEIKVPLIDEPLDETKTLIAIAMDNLKARKFAQVRQSVELSLEPLIEIVYKENLYLALFKEYIYKSYVFYGKDNFKSKYYLKYAYNTMEKAFLVASDENKDMIKGFKNQLKIMLKNFDKKYEMEKEYIIIIRQMKNL